MKAQRPTITTDNNNFINLNKRTKHFHHPVDQPFIRRVHQDRDDYYPRIPSDPSSSQSSPLQPATPDNSQSSDHSYSNESNTWPVLTRLDEIELLSVIEKHAETYSNDQVGNDDFFLSTCPPFQPINKITPISNSTDQHNLSDSLFNHQSSHHFQDNKPFKCSLCPKTFTRNYDLTRHKSSHQDQRQHVCSACGRSFNRRDALIRHSFVRGCAATT